MPARKISRFAAKRLPRQALSRIKVDDILARRRRLVQELALLRQHGDSRFLDNAQQLLTRWWSGASWSAREELLKSAEWLIRLERRSNAERMA
jgi:hypothetical protein